MVVTLIQTLLESTLLILSFLMMITIYLQHGNGILTGFNCIGKRPFKAVIYLLCLC